MANQLEITVPSIMQWYGGGVENGHPPLPVHLIMKIIERENDIQIHCLIDRAAPASYPSHLNNFVIIQIRPERYFPNRLHCGSFFLLAKLHRERQRARTMKMKIQM